MGRTVPPAKPRVYLGGQGQIEGPASVYIGGIPRAKAVAAKIASQNDALLIATAHTLQDAEKMLEATQKPAPLLTAGKSARLGPLEDVKEANPPKTPVR